MDYHIHGLNAGGCHFTNLILHLGSVLLLFWLFSRMTGELWRSAFVAALFALHPLHVESVAWIAERKDVLSAFFWMLTLCLYMRYTEKPKRTRYIATAVCFICGLMSKPMVVTLPVVMMLLDYWPLKRFHRGESESNIAVWQLKEKLPFFALSAISIFITLHAPAAHPHKLFPLSSRFANGAVSFVTYLGKTFLPSNLAVFNPFPKQFPFWQVSGAAVLIIILSIAAIAMMKRLPAVFVGWSWYMVAILPVIGIIQTWYHAMSDRYHYLPSIGIAVMLAWGVPPLIKNEALRQKILFPGVIAVLAIMAIMTRRQIHFWQNSIELWSHALQVTRNNTLAYNNLGTALSAKGNYEEAIVNFSKALHLSPDFAFYENKKIVSFSVIDESELYGNRGIAYAHLGWHPRAFADFDEAIRLNPDGADNYYNRGTAYAGLSRFQLAIADFSEAIRLKPGVALFYNSRGVACARFGLYQNAMADFDKALLLKPDYTDACNNRRIINGKSLPSGQEQHQ
jgi:protein O-mannosyl-transferase